MYRQFFALRQAPFSVSPDPNYLFMSRSHREALAHLYYGMEGEGGFVLLTGEIGCGKTTICRCLVQQTPANVQVACIHNPRLDALELLQSICEEFRIALPPQPHRIKTLTDLLNGFLLQSHSAGCHSVLIIDEAQDLGIEALEQLRLLTNLETNDCKLLPILLIGQPELRTLLEQPALEQLEQRIVARYHLEPLDEQETAHYVEHRLRVAGLKGPVPFSQAALEAIHRLSHGVPRRINLLCDRALQGAHAKQQQGVDDDLVTNVAPDVLGHKTTAVGVPASGSARWSTRHWAGVAASAALVTALGLWWTNGPATQAAQSAPEAEVPAANAPPATAATPTPTPTPTQNAATGMPALAQLPDDEEALWQTLGQAWGVQLPAQQHCNAALRMGLQCIRVTDVTPAALQQFDRPGLLLLNDKGTRRWVMVEALRQDRWHLRVGSQGWTVARDELSRWWRGEYASLWRLPPGQTKRLYTASPQDPAGRWMDEQLIRLQQQGLLNGNAADFTGRVRAFQKQFGLRGDGKPMPSTFLLLNRLAGLQEPRLQDEPR